MVKGYANAIVVLVLAPISQPLKPSPPAAQPQSNKPERILNEDFDDELDLPQPRFSIAIDDGISDDDSFQEVPPRLSMPMNKADQTGRSTEIGRRAISEQPLGRLSRGRFGSIDASDLSSLTDVSQPRIDDSIMDKVLDLNADELGDLGGGSDLGSVSFSKSGLY